ncbi:MAG TPA: stage II sporulation protein M [Candidatus Acidoferrales bacterium]|jgi:uncharacterized membrane protein SpoIIM required for sporulation|nr:stage II sporulation protein M [Candidatus Acidoferrales bacterium]
MISTRWLANRKLHWRRLEQLVDRSGRRGVSALDHDELQELGLLYRQTASDLATVREDITSRPFTSYLNQLLARAHNLIYMGKRPNWGGVLHFFCDTYPRIFRETFPLVLLSALIFAAGGIAGAAAMLRDPGFAHLILGPQMVETIEKREMWTHSILAVKPMAASGIMTNNIMVGFMMFAAGISAGLGTIWMLLTNGLLMGVLAVATARAGMALQLWKFVAAHGALELPAIFIAAGAGLAIARGLLFPGTLPRKDSVRLAGAQAAKLLLGTIPLLVVAGVIEAFISPTNIAAPLKILLSAVLFTALVFYLLSGRKKLAV